MLQASVLRTSYIHLTVRIIRTTLMRGRSGEQFTLPRIGLQGAAPLEWCLRESTWWSGPGAARRNMGMPSWWPTTHRRCNVCQVVAEGGAIPAFEAGNWHMERQISGGEGAWNHGPGSGSSLLERGSASPGRFLEGRVYLFVGSLSQKEQCRFYRGCRTLCVRVCASSLQCLRKGFCLGDLRISSLLFCQQRDPVVFFRW